MFSVSFNIFLILCTYIDFYTRHQWPSVFCQPVAADWTLGQTEDQPRPRQCQRHSFEPYKRTLILLTSIYFFVLLSLNSHWSFFLPPSTYFLYSSIHCTTVLYVLQYSSIQLLELDAFSLYSNEERRVDCEAHSSQGHEAKLRWNNKAKQEQKEYIQYVPVCLVELQRDRKLPVIFWKIYMEIISRMLGISFFVVFNLSLGLLEILFFVVVNLNVSKLKVSIENHWTRSH